MVVGESGMAVFDDGQPWTHKLLHSAREYLSFLMLLGSLFVVSGGIYLQGSFAGTPIVNTLRRRRGVGDIGTAQSTRLTIGI